MQLFLMTTIDIAEKKILIYLFTNVISVQIFKGAGIIIFMNILINVYNLCLNNLLRCFCSSILIIQTEMKPRFCSGKNISQNLKLVLTREYNFLTMTDISIELII